MTHDLLRRTGFPSRTRSSIFNRTTSSDLQQKIHAAFFMKTIDAIPEESFIATNLFGDYLATRFSLIFSKNSSSFIVGKEKPWRSPLRLSRSSLFR